PAAAAAGADRAVAGPPTDAPVGCAVVVAGAGVAGASVAVAVAGVAVAGAGVVMAGAAAARGSAPGAAAGIGAGADAPLAPSAGATRRATAALPTEPCNASNISGVSPPPARTPTVAMSANCRGTSVSA